MWNVFGRHNSGAAEATAAVRDALAEGRAVRERGTRRDKGGARAGTEADVTTEIEKSEERVSAAMAQLKAMVFGESEDVAELVQLARNSELLLTLATHLDVMGFETRKDAVQVFNNLLRRAVNDADAPAVPAEGAALVAALVAGYDDAEVALNCGAMLRECVRAEPMARVCVHSAAFWRFFDLVELNDFDVASDAFASFRDMLTRHVHVGAAFVESNMDQFVTAYNKLLRSSNYVTRRQSLKLLGELLVERKYFRVMTLYIASATNLRLIMNLLLDQRKNIQFEAFHVFKIFVANPNKTADVRQILLRNKDRLLSYLADFLCDRNDVQFQEDRNLILDEIRLLV